MNLLKDISAELIGMFVGDVRLSAAVLAVVAVAAAVIHLAHTDPLSGGAVLLGGCLLVVVEGVRRSALRLTAPIEPSFESAEGRDVPGAPR